MIKVKRKTDGKIFTTDMSEEEGIYEMHFCTSYTQVMIQELSEDGMLISKEIICKPVGTKPNPIDLIATHDECEGELLN